MPRIISVSLKCNLMGHVKIDRDGLKIGQWDHKVKNWSDAATSQGLPAAARRDKG